MTNKLKLMCILAHPDDESLGNGGILAEYAAEGVETYLVTATRGERGWFGDESDYPGLEALGKIREAELLAAARVLGIRQVDFLNYIDGDLDQAPPAEAVAQIVGHIRRVKPDVVVTLDAFAQRSLLPDPAFQRDYILERSYPASVWQSAELLVFRRADIRDGTSTQ